MSYQDHIRDLVNEVSEILSLDELEAKIYISLLRSGPITASALAKDLNIDRARMYRTIEKLVSQNIVFTTISNPKLCIANEPQEAVKMALRKKEDEVNRIKKSSEDVIGKITSQIMTNQVTNVPTFQVVQGRENVYSNIAQLIENSNSTVYIITTLDDISRMYHSSVPEKIMICEKNGGEVRLLVELDDPKLVPFVKRFNATETKIGKLLSRGRIVVQEEKQMIMSDSAGIDNLAKNPDLDFSLCTNSIEMINNIYGLCNMLWRSSQPLKTIDVKSFVKKSK